MARLAMTVIGVFLICPSLFAQTPDRKNPDAYTLAAPLDFVAAVPSCNWVGPDERELYHSSFNGPYGSSLQCRKDYAAYACKRTPDRCQEISARIPGVGTPSAIAALPDGSSSVKGDGSGSVPNQRTATKSEDSSAPLLLVLIENSSGCCLADIGHSWEDDFASQLPQNLWVGVMTFNSEPSLALDFTDNKQVVRDSFQRFTSSAVTQGNVFDALFDAGDRLGHVTGTKAILVIGSGMDGSSKHKYEETLAKLKQSQISVFSVIDSPYGDFFNSFFGSGKNTPANLAQLTGGEVYSLQALGPGKALGAAAKSITQNLSNAPNKLPAPEIGVSSSIRTTADSSSSSSASNGDVTDSTWDCDMNWSAAWTDSRGPQNPTFQYHELLTFKQDGTVKLDPFLADGKPHPELPDDARERQFIYETDDVWKQSGSSIAFWIPEWEPAVTFEGQMEAPDRIRFSPRNPTAAEGGPGYASTQTGEFICSLYQAGSNKQRASFPRLELVDTRLSTPSAGNGDEITVFFGIHDPKPDKPIIWGLQFPGGLSVVSISPPGSGEAGAGLVRGEVPSGAHVGVTFRVDRRPYLEDGANIVFYLMLEKDEVVNEQGDTVIVNNCAQQGVECANDFKVKYIPR